MKQLTCEMCGSTDLIKQDGVFVCQTCGCKYSVEEAKKKGLHYHVGNILSSDMFYNPQLPPVGTTWTQMGVLAVEMESAALYSNAAYAGVNAICILTISDSSFTDEVTTAEERQETFTDMIDVALKLA